MEAREPQEQAYTYGQYLDMDLDDRYELIDGILIKKSRPSIIHQDISRELMFQLTGFLHGKKCKVYNEIDVAFVDESCQDEKNACTVFVPDIAVVCDKDKLKDGCYLGAPTVIIEILSKSTASMDKLVKYDKYARAGVNEYWIVSIEEKSIMVYLNDSGLYRPKALYPFESKEAAVFSLENCVLDLSVLLEV
ncbi:MAG: Uma2 family endonuclease [Oscillospiraceae bacterium]|nr:Uma2 family endonuclease [Oscillospiraceae bacterium]